MGNEESTQAQSYPKSASNRGTNATMSQRLLTKIEQIRGMNGFENYEDNYPYISLKDFVHPGKGFMFYIGQGGFGKVVAMRKKNTNKYFAIKSFSKARLLAKGEVDQVMNELKLLMRLPHNHFIINLFYAFQDKDRLYMCTNLMLGGSLQHKLTTLPSKKLDPQKVKVLAAELVLAVQFLHANRVVHRDVKPDNILLDHTGHMRLTDFNISLTIPEEDEPDAYHRDGWGTRGFRAPEIYLRKGKGLIFACDWWSVGAVIYVMLTGKLPYSKKREEESNVSLVTRMRAEEFNRSRLPDKESCSLCEQLLRYKPEKRLGCSSGPKSEVLILTHPYFKSIDWDKYESGAMLKSSIGNIPSSEDTSIGIENYAQNFESRIENKELIQTFERNLGANSQYDTRPDEEGEYGPVSPKNQPIFEEWAFNVDFILERNSKPQFSLVHTISSMSPNEIKSYVIEANPETLKALRQEIQIYKEQAMLENYQHVKAEIRNEQLMQQNLKLTRELAAYKRKFTELGFDEKDVLERESDGLNKERRRSNDTESVEEVESGDVSGSYNEDVKILENDLQDLSSQQALENDSEEAEVANQSKENQPNDLREIFHTTKDEVIMFESDETNQS